ncbi:hypothetical protein [Photobacterium damselae]|uniref:Uncharacterized protein n=1 Tax=Photobacterium damselae TaxID=38293 RepID=A0A2T3Q7I8_PHODM|nr:hypothetical protein [Photobacterium damselae]ARR51568.1 hypothetical protein CAY62_19445 [Photobacterium damselae subsp. damselae]PSW79943.1 hypothetical protein CTN07_20395 [Photobacterium damselae]UKA03895.1 hypothetical protein IHC89_15310 [Photobacterium damselae subsp. damselae]SPY44054.1 Uncharacterised protein [Photobacterium damselae]SUB90651.1 Uncharacterised protein [Photobacterium damselae]
MTAKLKGYTPKQRSLAYVIRHKILLRYPWAYDVTQANRLKAEIERITSPMFFIKYQHQLNHGSIAESLSQYNDENHARRASFVLQ